MSSFKLLKQIADQSRKDLIFGYIRELSKSHAFDLNIPLVIKYFCLQYYFINEYFTRHGNNIAITNSQGTNNNLDIMKVKKFGVKGTVYGNINIDISYDEHIWKFIVNVDTESALRIGIDSSNKRWINNDFTEQHKYIHVPSLKSHIRCCYGFNIDICSNTTNLFSIMFDGNQYQQSSTI